MIVRRDRLPEAGRVASGEIEVRHRIPVYAHTGGPSFSHSVHEVPCVSRNLVESCATVGLPGQ